MSKELGLFMHAVWQDGTLSAVRTPEELLEVMNKHEKRVEGTNAFLVTSADALNELAPVEVLAGKRFQVQIDNPVDIVFEGDPPQSKLEPRSQAVIDAHNRFLDMPLEARAAHVIAVAKRWGLEEQ
jgi:hypothetical protein